MTRFPPIVSRLIPSLGRENDHEVVAAARALDAALKNDGSDLHALARAIESIGRPADNCMTSSTPTSSTGGGRWSPPASGTPSFGDMARACRDLDRGRLELRERQFVVDMVRRGFSYRPSPRQSAWLSDIFNKLNERAAA